MEFKGSESRGPRFKGVCFGFKVYLDPCEARSRVFSLAAFGVQRLWYRSVLQVFRNFNRHDVRAKGFKMKSLRVNTSGLPAWTLGLSFLKAQGTGIERALHKTRHP